MRTTLKDVARQANVSIKTVSNVVHNCHDRVSPATRDRVLAAIAALDYRPNLAARQLRQGKVGVLALALPSFDNPYFAEIATMIVEVATERGYVVLIDHTGGTHEHETLVAKGLRPHLIDGIILNPLALNENDIQGDDLRLPIVLLGERLLHASCDHVLIDNVAAARCATAHLLALGRQRVAAMGATVDPDDWMPQLRLQGYREALKAAGRSIEPELIATMPARSFTRADGADVMRRLLALPEPPDAVFCFNDLVAIGAISVLRKTGLRIPDDVAVVGIDNIEEAEYTLPALTTIAPDKRTIARLAVEILLARIQGEHQGPPVTQYVPFHLMVRDSTSRRGARPRSSP